VYAGHVGAHELRTALLDGRERRTATQRVRVVGADQDDRFTRRHRQHPGVARRRRGRLQRKYERRLVLVDAHHSEHVRRRLLQLHHNNARPSSLPVQRPIQDLGRGVRQGVWGWKSAIGVQGQSPGRRSVGQVPQKLVIFYSDVISKKAKHH